MRQRLSDHFGFRLAPHERNALTRLAEVDGLSEAAALRRLIRNTAFERGLWPSAKNAHQTAPIPAHVEVQPLSPETR